MVVRRWPTEYETPYKNGKRHGICKSWYEDGQPMYESPYKNGKKDGIWKGWYADGQLQYEYPYKNGKRHGMDKDWCEKGTLKRTRYYYEGKELKNFNRYLHKLHMEQRYQDIFTRIEYFLNKNDYTKFM